MIDATADLAAKVRSVYWYHSIDLPIDGGVVRTPGEYDHSSYLTKYGFPESLAGKRVLDIGAADGYFSFEFERRGAAEVVAGDLFAGYPDVPFHEVERLGRGTGGGRASIRSGVRAARFTRGASRL
jgi:hypothetical protein